MVIVPRMINPASPEITPEEIKAGVPPEGAVNTPETPVILLNLPVLPVIVAPES